MKKILLLGGSSQQVVAIKTAKELGYYTILCDFLSDNPGQYVADKFYLESTTDKDIVLDIAKREHIDGILAYASDPAAPTAAYVAEMMDLPTNPYKAVDTLCNKDKFRRFLVENGFNTPVACGYENKDSALADISKFDLPVIIKPVDSSGSKGATVIYTWDEFDDAIDFAFSFSRNHRVIVEEFVEKKHQFLIGGDVFVVDGKVTVWGLLNCHRDSNVNPLVPVGKSYPLLLEKEDEQAVHDTLQAIVDRLGIRFGSVNVELVVDKNNKVFPIDIGPRAGGNMIPELLGMIFDIDLVKMAVLTAMGEKVDSKEVEGKGYFATHNLHSSRDGIYSSIEFSSDIKKHVFRKNIYKIQGDKVEFFDNAAKALGIVFMQFKNQEEMIDLLSDINKKIKIVLK